MPMSKKVKFSSKIDEAVLGELREYSELSKQNIADILTDAVSQHLSNVKVRPAFKLASQIVMNEHDELLKNLAK